MQMSRRDSWKSNVSLRITAGQNPFSLRPLYSKVCGIGALCDLGLGCPSLIAIEVNLAEQAVGSRSVRDNDDL